MDEREQMEVESTHDFSVEVRGNGTEVFREPYTEQGILRLKKLVLTFYKQGERKFYSIHVDGETVVERTSDGRKFNRYLEFVYPDTRLVEVRIYKGNSFNCNRYLFVITKGLSGTTLNEEADMQKEIEKALKEQERENELVYLRSELAKKDKKLRKLKKIVSDKDETLSLGTVKDFLIEGKGLVDAFRGNASDSQLGNPPRSPQSEVTIEAAEEEVPEEQQIFNELFAHVGTKGIKKALKIMAILSQNPDVEQAIIKELNKKKEEEKNGNA